MLRGNIQALPAIMLGTMLFAGGVTAGDLFQPLVIGGQTVKWFPREDGRVVLTFAIARDDMTFEGAINCARIRSPRALLEKSAIPMMTDGEAKAWINKVVYSSDGTNLGEVANILRDNSGHVTELQADIGGFLGLGETRVRVAPSDFKLDKDRVVLNIPADQAKTLPKIEK